jgi:hypothetical protein
MAIRIGIDKPDVELGNTRIDQLAGDDPLLVSAHTIAEH